jgi:hypothetical protein
LAKLLRSQILMMKAIFVVFCTLKFVEYTEYQGFRQVNGLDWVFGRPVTGARGQRVECR